MTAQLPETPDFAFPRKVLAEAEAAYKASSGLPRMQAAMQIAMAKSEIDPDSAFAIPAFIAATAAEETDPAVKGLLTLYRARVLENIYNENSYVYDQVSAPLTPLPEDVAKWSGEQFRSRIEALTTSAWELMQPAFAQSIANYKLVIESSAESRRYYPTLRDFAAIVGTSLYDTAQKPDLAAELTRKALEAAPAASLSRAAWLVRRGNDKAILEAYRANPGGEAAGVLLYHCDGALTAPEYIAYLRDYLAKAPASDVSKALKAKLMHLTQPVINVELPSVVLPGKPFNISVEHYYTSQAGVRVSRIINPKARIDSYRLQKVGEYVIDTDTLSTGTATIELTLPSKGWYQITPMANGEANTRRWRNITVQATPYIPATLSLGNRSAAIITNFEDGSPVSGAQINLLNRDNGNVAHRAGSTDAAGTLMFEMPSTLKKNHTYPLELTVGGKQYFFGNNISFENSQRSEGRESVEGRFYVSRPIYRPGEILEWSLVATKIEPKKRSAATAAHTKIDVVLRDANYTPVDTLKVTTDAYGRATGSFTIPTGRLTGNYSLQARHGKQYVCQSSVMVSDFKAPVFEIIDTQASKATDGSGTVTVSGSVRTYSGMPVADASVDIRLTETPRWWWRWFAAPDTDGDVVASGKTDAEGKFSILIPADEMEDDTDYRATITATDAAAATANASQCFTTGKPYVLDASGDQTLCCDQAIDLPVKAYGPDGQPAELTVDWRLTSDSTTIEGHGTVSKDGGLKVTLPDAAPGVYNLVVKTPVEAMADSLVVENILIYSLERNLVPEEAQILPLSLQSTIGADGSAEVKVGVPRRTYLYMYCKGREEERLPDVTMQVLEPGFTTLKVAAPGDDKEASLTLFAVHNGEMTRATIHLVRPDESALTLRAESMRDRLAPGTPETWRFTLTRPDGKAASGAMIATLYNHSLDALGAMFNWSSSLPTYYGSTWVDFDALEAQKQSSRFYVSVNIPSDALSMPEPSFRYVPSAAPRYFARNVAGAAYGVAYGVMKKSAAAMSDMAESESIEEEAAPTGGLDEVVGVANDGGNTVSPQDADTFKYRPSEVLQAFWMPNLTVNKKGEAEITFTTPDAVGAWRFVAMAWNESLRSSLLTRDVVTSKPVMVQPNAPRFLRTGDHAELLATVYNNSGSDATVAVRCEIFNIVSGAVITTSDTTLTLADQASGIAKITAEALAGSEALGYRVRATAGNFSDGEQLAIPVLESAATVVDTQNFVLTDARPSFSAVIPADAKVIGLQYCQNPVWDAVRALPDLVPQVKITSSIDAAQLLFGALTARGLNRQFPEIRRVIDIWESNPADSALVSKLAQNEDLKLALLGQTPWMGAATSQTERMMRLSSVFSDKSIDRSLNRALDALTKLRGADGGYRWGSWCNESSLWATEEVAWSLANVNAQGYLPPVSKAATIAKDALAYIDSHIKPEANIGYALILAFFPDYKPTTTTARRAIDKTVQLLLKDWKNLSTDGKARAALILDSRGYKNVAAEVMESVMQFGVTDANGTISFPSVRQSYDYSYILRAMARIVPDNKAIDAVRRTLLLRTMATDDLASRYPAPIISALLATGTRWTDIDAGSAPSVTVAGSPLEITKIEAASGNISTRLAATDAGKEVAVTRTAAAPVSYGALTTIATRPSAEVKAARCEQLAIEKQLLVERDGKWYTVRSAALGDRVRVRLVLTVKEDLEYVTINDERAATFEPVDQLPGFIWASGLGFYRENSDSRTRIFITFLPKGTYSLEYDVTAATAGSFASGIATAQSQYAPQITAHSAGNTLTVAPR